MLRRLLTPMASGEAARLFATLLLIAGAARGGTILTWYANPPTAGGSGTWNTTGDNWSSDGASFSAWTNSGIDTALFSGTGGTLALGTAIAVAGLDLDSGGFTFTGGNSLTVTNGGQITLGAGTGTNIDTALVVSPGALLQGTGTLNVNGASGGSLTLSGIGLSSSSNPVLNLASDPSGGGAALTINGASGSGSFGGTLEGSGTLEMSGGTVLTLSGTNSSFTGSTVIGGGQIVLGSGLALESSTVGLDVNNGLNLNGQATATIAGLTWTGALNLGTTDLFVGGSNADTVYSGVFSGTTGGLTKVGGGTLTLSGGGTMDGIGVQAGAVNITGGTLALTDPSVGINASGGTLTLSGGTINANAGSASEATGSGMITVTGPGATLNAGSWYADNGGTLNALNGAVVNGAYTIVGMNGAATLNISGGSTVTDTQGALGNGPGGQGTATVSGAGSVWANQLLGLGTTGPTPGTGTLNINSGGSVTVAGATTLSTSGSSIDINQGTLTTGSLVGTTGTINLINDPSVGGALTITGTTGNGTFNGTLEGGGTLVKQGSSMETLGGSNPLFTGSTVIAGGQIVLGGALALESSTVGLVVDNGLNLNGLASATIAGLTGTGALNLGTTDLFVGRSNADTVYSGVFSGTTGGLTKVGGGTLTLSGGGTMDGIGVQAGAVNITGGTLALTDPATGINVTGGTLTLSGGTINANPASLSQASGSGVITITGSGSTLNAGSWYADSGGTLNALSGAMVDGAYTNVGVHGAGTLNISGGSSVTDAQGLLGSAQGGQGTATVAGTGSLWANQLLSLSTAGATPGTGTLNVNGGGSVTVAGVTTLSTSGSSINIDRGTLTTSSLVGTTGTIDLINDPGTGAALTINGVTGTAGEFDGTITGAGTLSKQGGSVETLGGANPTFTGTTLIGGGQLVVGNRFALESSTVDIAIDNGLNLNGLATATIGALAGAGALNLGGTQLVAGTNSANTTYAGVLNASTGGLTKVGSGTLTLSGGGTIDNLGVNTGEVNITAGLTLTDGNTAINANGGLLLLTGGTINTNANSISQAFGSGVITVNGVGATLNAGSAWEADSGGTLNALNGGAVNSVQTIAGVTGVGVLNISGGATVTDMQGVLGDGADGQGTATVSGTGSLWANQLLSLGTAGATPGTGTLNVNGGGSVTVAGVTTLSTSGSSINIDRGTLTTSSLVGTTGTIDLINDPGTGAALTINGVTGTAGEFDGTITGAGTLSKQGGSVETLGGANPTFTGTTLIGGGQLVVGNRFALESSTVDIAIDNGLNLNGLATATIGALAGAGALNLGGTQLVAGTNSANTTYAGVLNASTGGLTKVGSGTLTLSGGGTIDNLGVNTGEVNITAGLTLTDGNTAINANGGLLLLTGGTINTNANSISQAFGSGVITVNGVGATLNAGSAWEADSGGTLNALNGGAVNSVQTIAGVTGVGVLNISGGATVTDMQGVLGDGADGQGTATVSGTGSLWANQLLSLGTAGATPGTGTLNVNGGGSVTVAGVTTLSTSGSSINIDRGTLTTSSLVGTTGTIDLINDPGTGAALTINGVTGTAGEFDGTITGAGTLSKQGGSVETLGGANPTFTGTTLIGGGQLVVGNRFALESSTVDIAIDNGLNLNGLATATIGALAGAGALNLGGTQLVAGTNSANTTYAGVLNASTGGLTKVGSGTLTLSGGGTIDNLGVNTGEVNITAGLTLTDGNTAINANGGLLLLTGGTINTNANSISQAFGSGVITVNGVGATLNAGSAWEADSGGTLNALNGGAVNAASVIVGVNGAGALHISGGSTVTDSFGVLGNGQDSQGAATVTGTGSLWANQVLSLGTAGATPGTGTLNIDDQASVTVANATTLLTSGSSINIDRGMLTTSSLVGPTGTIDLINDPVVGGALTISGITGVTGEFDGTFTGGGSLVKQGGSVETLGGTSPLFTGSTIIAGGQVALSSGLALESSLVDIVADNGLNLSGLASATIGGLTGAGTLNLGTTDLFVGTNNIDTSYSGVFSGTTGGLTKVGTGTLALSGGGTMDGIGVNAGTVNITTGTLALTDPAIGINATGGTLIVSGGTVSAQAGSVSQASGSGVITVTGPETTLNAGSWSADSGGTLNALNGAMVNGIYTIVGVNGSATLNISGGATLADTQGILGSAPGGQGTATVTGQGSLWANQLLTIGTPGAPPGTGTLNINGGSVTTALLVGTTGGTINLTADPAGGAALTINGASGAAEFDGTITGAGSVAKSGSSVETLGGANTFTGSSTITGGQLVLANVLALRNSTVGIDIDNGLNLNGLPNAVIGGLAGTGALNLGTTFLDAGGNNADTSYSGAFSATTGGLSKIGTGTLTLSGGGTIGSLNVDAGTVDIAGATLTLTDGAMVGSEGVLNVSGELDTTGLSTNGQVNIFDGGTLAYSGADLVLGAGSRTYVGSLADPGGTLSDTGGMIELNGALLVNNGTVSGTLDVNSGGEAEGAGTYGAVDISAGGLFHPGNSPGTVTSSSATFGAGGALEFDIDNATGTEGTDWSLWNISGDLDIMAGMTPDTQFTIFVDSLTSGDAAGPLANFDPTQSFAWTFLDAAGITGFSASEFVLNTTSFDEALDGGTFSLVSNGQDLTLDFTAAANPTPEPGTLFLLGSGVLALLLVMRKRTGGRRV